MSVDKSHDIIKKLFEISIRSNIKLAGGQIPLAKLVTKSFMVNSPISQSTISKWLNAKCQARTFHIIRMAIGESSLWKSELTTDYQIKLIESLGSVPSFHSIVCYQGQLALFDGLFEFRREVLLSLISEEGRQIMASPDEVTLFDWEHEQSIEVALGAD